MSNNILIYRKMAMQMTSNERLKKLCTQTKYNAKKLELCFGKHRPKKLGLLGRFLNYFYSVSQTPVHAVIVFYLAGTR